EGATPPSKLRMKIYLFCGVLSIGIVLFNYAITFSFYSLLFLLPLLVTSHFVYLSKGYLW
ncbi:hypothetical protein, partial [Aurantivibrio infirmus]